MDYILMIVVGFVGGGVCTYFGLDRKRRQLAETQAAQDKQVEAIENASRDLDVRRAQMESEISAKTIELDTFRSRTIEGLKKQRDQVQQELQSRQRDFETLQNSAVESLRKRKEELDNQVAEFKSKVIKYEELRDENFLLRRELRTLGVRIKKSTLDSDAERQRNDLIMQKVEELGSRYLKENVKWIGQSLNANNYAACKERLLKVIERCRDIGFNVTVQEEESLLAELRAQYEMEVRAALEREEQARIRAQIREEQKREREIQKELERVDRERSVLRAALDRALAQARDEHSAEIEELRSRLADAEARERAISQAQLTKAGFVYVISNIGSFGEGVFKIGMTRRLEPLERVRELGDASVPFPFDVHMLVSCEDAPALEHALHRHLHKCQINRANPRKEFYKTDIETVARIVRENHGEVQYVADAEALQYRQSLTMSEDDQEFIEHVFDDAEEDESTYLEDSA